MNDQAVSAAIAPWRQVCDAIERSLATGVYPPNLQVPAEAVLAETFGVNRHAARHALTALAGAVWSAPNGASGTYAVMPRLAYPLRPRTRFSKIAGAGGREAPGRSIASSIEEAPRDIARALGPQAGDPLFRLETPRHAGRTPVWVSTNWLARSRPPRNFQRNMNGPMV